MDRCHSDSTWNSRWSWLRNLPYVETSNMIPLLPSNPMTITPRQFNLDDPRDRQDKLEHLRRMDTLQRSTSPDRELLKSQIRDLSSVG